MPAEEDTGASAVSRELPIRNKEADAESFEYGLTSFAELIMFELVL